MGALSFSLFRVKNVKLINEKNSLIVAVSKWSFKMAWTVILSCFLSLACFVVSTYMIFTWVCSFLMAYASSATYLLTRLKKKFSAYSQKRNDHMQVYIIIKKGQYNFFIWNDLLVDTLTGSRLMPLWNAGV